MDEETRILIKSIYEQNKQIKHDIGLMNKELQSFSRKIQEIENTTTTLKVENIETKKELEIVRRKLKENNLIIFGVQEEEDTDTVATVRKTLKEKLNLDLDEVDINKSYRIGQERENKPKPIILELKGYRMKKVILENCRKLKGTGIIITHDLTESERVERELLYKHYKLARQQNSKAKIYKNKIVINGKTFKYEDLKDQAIEAETINCEKLFNEKNEYCPPVLQEKKNTRSANKEKKSNK